MPGICPGISRRKRPGKGSSPHPRRPGGQFHRGVNHEPHQEQVGPPSNKSGPPRFQVGNKVRVKYGVIDPDFPDIPLGGSSRTPSLCPSSVSRCIPSLTRAVASPGNPPDWHDPDGRFHRPQSLLNPCGYCPAFPPRTGKRDSPRRQGNLHPPRGGSPCSQRWQRRT